MTFRVKEAISSILLIQAGGQQHRGMYFIAGITGQVGAAAAQQLLEQGQEVRTLARDPLKAASWAQKGVDVRQGDFLDPTAVAQALAGVEGASLMMPPEIAPAAGFPAAKAVVASFREALRLSPPPRLAVLSSIGSEQASRTGNIIATHLLEQALTDAAFPVAVIRAGSFLENYAFGLARTAETGVFDTFLTPTDRAVPMVATADIGREIARRLTNGWSGHQVVELGSPLSPDDLAQAMTDVLARPVQARSIPRDQWPVALQAMGLAPGTSSAYEEMQDGFNSGWIRFGIAGTSAVAASTTPAEVFK